VSKSAIFSACGTYRYRLDRDVQEKGLVFAYFGVNGATADHEKEDQTSRKWFGFTLRNGGRRYIAANPFAFCATDVRELAYAADPIGPENGRYVREVITEADILVPCWGSRAKLPPNLRGQLDDLRDRILDAGKPVKVFGFTASGDPKHPLMLGYDTPLVDWPRGIFG
jgi:hypothetical protein